MHVSRRSCKLTFFLVLPVCCHSASIAPLESSNRDQCLLQSSRSTFSAVLKQPVVDVRRPDPTAPDAAKRKAGSNSPLENAASHIYDLSVSLFARVAYFIARNWATILGLFCAIFAVAFPIGHWVFEAREDERIKFNENDAQVDVSHSLVETVKHIRINQRGGLTKVRNLIEADMPKPRRTMKVLAYVVSISFNVFMLVQQDVLLLHGAVLYYSGDHSDLPTMLKKYLEFNGNISLISVRHAVCVALAELLGLAAMLIWIIYRGSVFQLFKNSNHARFDAFLGLHDAFEGVSLLGGFSALRLLSVAHPALIMRNFQWHMARPFMGGSREKLTMQLVYSAYFVVTRLAAVSLGVLAFGVKVAFASVQVHMPIIGIPWWPNVIWTWCIVIMLLEQTLGAVGVEHVMWWRMLFIIGEGGDRQITLEKVQIANVFLSRIMQCIYEEYWCKGKYRQFLVLMMTFDHVDLQYLLIDEGDESKSLARDDFSEQSGACEQS